MLTKQEIIDHPDFEKVVLFFLKKYSVQFKLNTLDISTEEFIHEVRAHMWLRGGSNEKLHVFTTMVIKHCEWTVGKLLRKHFSTPRPLDIETLDSLESTEDCDANESTFLLNKAIQRTTCLTGIEHEVIQMLSRGLSLRQISKTMGYEYECVKSAHVRAIQKIRRANPHGVC